MGKGKTATAKPAVSAKDKAKADQAKPSAAPKARKDEQTTERIIDETAVAVAVAALASNIAAAEAAAQDDSVQSAPAPQAVSQTKTNNDNNNNKNKNKNNGGISYVVIPREVRECIPAYKDVDRVPYYRPSMREELSAQASNGFAIRCNSSYETVHAALLAERGYVRELLHNSKKIVFTSCYGHFPLLLVADFGPTEKITPKETQISSILRRVIHVTPQNHKTLKKIIAPKTAVAGRIPMFVQGDNDSMSKLQAYMKAAKVQHSVMAVEKVPTKSGIMYFFKGIRAKAAGAADNSSTSTASSDDVMFDPHDYKPQHSYIEGLERAVVSLNREELEQVSKSIPGLAFMPLQFINTYDDQRAKRTITLRWKVRVDAQEAFAAVHRLLHGKGAYFYFNGYGTVRISFAEGTVITTTMLATLREQVCKDMTDVPSKELLTLPDDPDSVVRPTAWQGLERNVFVSNEHAAQEAKRRREAEPGAPAVPLDRIRRCLQTSVVVTMDELCALSVALEFDVIDQQAKFTHTALSFIVEWVDAKKAMVAEMEEAPWIVEVEGRPIQVKVLPLNNKL